MDAVLDGRPVRPGDGRSGPSCQASPARRARRSGRPTRSPRARWRRPAARCPTARASSTPRPSSPTWTRRLARPAARSCSDRSRSCQVADDLDDAIAIANASPWGLGASVWAEDRDEQRTRDRGARGRDGVRERGRRLHARAALRRDQALRLRPRARRPRHPRVHQREVVLRGTGERGRDPRRPTAPPLLRPRRVRAAARRGRSRRWRPARAASSATRRARTARPARPRARARRRPRGGRRASSGSARRRRLHRRRDRVVQPRPSSAWRRTATRRGRDDRSRCRAIEHHAVLDAARLARRGMLAAPCRGASTLAVDADGVVDLDELAEVLVDGADRVCAS